MEEVKKFLSEKKSVEKIHIETNSYNIQVCWKTFL